jgi:ubiquitin-like protein Pup
VSTVWNGVWSVLGTVWSHLDAVWNAVYSHLGTGWSYVVAAGATVLIFVLGVIVAAMMKLLSDEVRGWVGRIPFLLLWFAARRLPGSHRTDLYDDWKADLAAEMNKETERPVTRVWFGIKFAIGLIHKGRSVARELGTTRVELDRAQQREDDIDAILDGIEVLEEDAEAFVRSYIPKGGE